MKKKTVLMIRHLRLVEIFIGLIIVSTLLSILIHKYQSNDWEHGSMLAVTGDKFDIDRHILVFLHIQKTGGSEFDRNIVKHLLVHKGDSQYRKACVHTAKDSAANNPKEKFKKYSCVRNVNKTQNWLFTRQTFGWACGLHADVSDLLNCTSRFYPAAKATDFVYFTILREPVRRYVSEWNHVSRGATWIKPNEKVCLVRDYVKCFNGRAKWDNVTLDEFMACETNLANNRQTRMLARYDAGFSLCEWNRPEHRDELLERAKKTLKSLRFFALNEYMRLSEALFERTFEQVFKFDGPLPRTKTSIAESYLRDLNNRTILQRIETLNDLDMQLYLYAVDLFFQRLQFYNISF